jgi:four helix bundle protein
MKIYGFEKLVVWQDARQLCLLLYKNTKDFPKDELFGITSQIRRAGISITCNIAEGTSRWSQKEKIRFIEIAYGSLMEVLNCTILASDLEYLSDETYLQIREKVDQVSFMLTNLKKSFENKSGEG